MPKFNPKHNKKIDQSVIMGAKAKVSKCSVVGCSQDADHHMSYQNLEGYLTQLGFTLTEESRKTHRVGLCKEHHKPFKKLKDKDEKYTRLKDFSKEQAPRKDKPHYMLE